MKKIITCIIGLCVGVNAHAQRISALTATNVVVDTNIFAVVVNPNAATGTRSITVGNLFSNRFVLSSVVTLPVTNLTSILSGRYTNDASGRYDGFVLFTAAESSGTVKRTNLLTSAVTYPGREITVCDGSTTAGGSNIWVATVSSQTINGGPTSTNITVNNGSITLISDGANWRIKARAP